jgi:hypothetical protein
VCPANCCIHIWFRYTLVPLYTFWVVLWCRTVVSVSSHYKNPIKRVGLVQTALIIISLKINLFSPRYMANKLPNSKFLTFFIFHPILTALIIISLKINLFSPRYSWKFAELVLNNNHSLIPYMRNFLIWAPFIISLSLNAVCLVEKQQIPIL